jgi:hypothetical protein
MLNRSKLLATTLLLGVFAAGIAIGGPAWGALTEDRTYDRGTRNGSSESRDREHRSYSELLQAELNLSAGQRAAVDSILASNQSDMRVVWREMRARIDTLRQDVVEEIMQLLREDQQTRYRELLERSRRRGERERATRNDRQHE